MRLSVVFLQACLLWFSACAIQDVTLPQLEYIANHISQSECRQLVASLKSTSFEPDPRFVKEGLSLPATTPCIQLLVSWGEEEGKDKVLVLLARRLRQLHHPDVSDWLSKTSFEKLDEDLQRSFPEKRKCRCRARSSMTSTTSAPKTTQVLPGKLKKNQSVLKTEQKNNPAEQEFRLNAKILEGLEKFSANTNLRNGLLLGVSILVAVVLFLICIKAFIKWLLKRRHRKKGYRKVENISDEERGASYDDYEEEFKKYCKR